MKKLSIAAITAALALSLSACGGNTTDTPKANPDVKATDLSQLEVNKEIAAMVPEAVKADGKLIVGNNVYYAPAEFYAADGKTAQGYDIDLANALAKVMGLKADVQNADFANIIPGIGSKYEVGIANFSITPERLKTVDMLKYFAVGSSWTVKNDDKADFNPANPCGKVIGVQTGTVQDEVVDKLNEKCPADKQLQIQRYQDQSAVTTALVGGKLDAMYTDSSVADYAVQITDKALKTTGEVEDLAGIGIVTSKENPELTKATQAALQYLIDNGYLNKVFDTWGITEGIATKAELNPES